MSPFGVVGDLVLEVALWRFYQEVLPGDDYAHSLGIHGCVCILGSKCLVGFGS